METLNLKNQQIDKILKPLISNQCSLVGIDSESFYNDHAEWLYQWINDGCPINCDYCEANPCFM